MITLGFKNKFSGMLRAIAATVLGLIMIIKPATALILVVKVLAAFLIAAGLISILYGVINKERGALSLMLTNSIVDIILGVVIFMFPGQVASVVIWLIGAALVFLGILQIVVLASTARVGGMLLGLFILPVLCILGGGLLLVNPFDSASTLTLIAGIVVLIYGVSECFATWRMNRVMKSYKKEYEQNGVVSPLDDASDEIKDVDYEKVDEQ